MEDKQLFAIYARVSTNRSKCRACKKMWAEENSAVPDTECPACASADIEHGQTPENQLLILRNYVQQRDGQVVKEYVDRGISGTKESRPALNQLMEDAKARKFGAVVIWRFDRFARSVPHLIRAVDSFKEQGIRFISIKENIDTTEPLGRMFLIIIAAIAEFERSLTQERVKLGQARAISQGKKIGRGFAIVDREKVRALRDSGLSLRQVAEQTGISHGTVATICKE